jgi:hypothetical protein
MMDAAPRSCSRSIVRLALCALGLAAACSAGGCASSPSAWEQGFVGEPGVSIQPEAARAAGGPTPVNIRSVPIERVDAVMLELDAEAAASDIPKEQWPADKNSAAKARLLKALQVTQAPDSVEVRGVSRFRSTTLLRPDSTNSESLAAFARSINANTALWSMKYLGKADKIVEKPVTNFGSRGYWGRGRHWDDDCWSDHWGSSTTWVPVRVQADEYLYVVFYLNQ